jgi:hypothetical protein
MVIAVLGLAACGGGGERQDANEPSGNFPVEVTKASFPGDQVLANAENLRLAIKNSGPKTIPDLAVTIHTGRIKAGITATGTGQGSFNIRLNNPNLSNPNRPVWVLDNDYPKLLEPGAKVSDLHAAPTAGAEAAQTDTFQFGPVAPGVTKDIFWRVVPVMAGSYPVHYDVEAGLQGKAKAVSPSGGKVRGGFAVTIERKVPETCVTGSGQVTKCGP